MTDKNITFFSNNKTYQSNVNSFDTYATMRRCIENELTETKSLLDIGNGGFFNYEVSHIPRVVALDLFLDESIEYPPNVTAVKGDALDFTISKSGATEKFDAIVVQMLIHHLCGKSPEEAVRNVQRVYSRCREHLAPGGKIIIVESTVPQWFYTIEKALFRVLQPLWFFSHPLVIQHTTAELLNAANPSCLDVAECFSIPKGRMVLQFGIPFPAALTPVQPVKLVLRRAE